MNVETRVDFNIEKVLKDKYFPCDDFKITFINEGHANINFKIVLEKKRYFGKVYREHIEETLNFELILNNLLLSLNFNAPKIISTIAGDKYCFVDESLLVVHEYISGRHPVQSKDNLFRIGSMLGVLHLLEPNLVPDIKYNMGMDDMKKNYIK